MIHTDTIEIILVGTSHPGNIGSTARAMKVMGFTHLRLVNPVSFPDKEAVIMSSHADDVLENAKVFTNFEQAIADCNLLIGTSARSRELPWPMLTPKALAKQLSEKNYQRIGIVFGREKTGLTNEELGRCHFHLQIPTNHEYMSLNLAQAVQVITYELAQASKIGQVAEEKFEELATADSLDGFFKHMEQALLHIGYLDPRRPKKLKERLTRLFQRSQLETSEVDLLRGIFSKMEKLTKSKAEGTLD